MKTYQLIDGTLVEGRNSHELVKSMAERKFVRVHNYAKYRSDTAAIIGDMYEAAVDPETDDTFIDSLISAGLLEELEAAEQS